MKLHSTTIIREKFPKLKITGPERAGKDIRLGEVFKNYPKPNRPVDFILYHCDKPVAIGLARYDSDRGGAQEDDRTGQYRDCANELLSYAKQNKLNLKVIFLNDGPGLLLGSMWGDYSGIENLWPGLIKIGNIKNDFGKNNAELASKMKGLDNGYRDTNIKNRNKKNRVILQW